MDQIHDIQAKPWISQRLTNLKNIINERQNDLITNGVNLSASQLSGQCDQYESDLLEKLNKFIEESEDQVKPFFLFNSTDDRTLIPNPECKLKMFQLQLEHAKRMVNDRGYKLEYLMNLKTTRRELLMRHLASTNRPPAESGTNAIQRTPEPFIAVVVVQIWPQPCRNNKIRMEKEILFRADQCLTDLRDQFKCERDYSVPMDLSENPEQAERIFRGELFKSGFFLIGDTFYNDMRDRNNIDLSATIVEWADKGVVIVEDGKNVEVSRGIGPFNRVKMESHKFEDLTFRLGCPYLYTHQGDCEHLFTISEIRYMENNSQLQQTKFPYVTATSIGKSRDTLRCYMCEVRLPHWYTRSNDRLPVDPYFFCETCFYAFNYDKDRRKIGHFQAYLYTSSFGIPDTVNMTSIT